MTISLKNKMFYVGLFLNIVSCAPSAVIQIQRPAEINLSEYKKVAVMPFTQSPSETNQTPTNNKLINGVFKIVENLQSTNFNFQNAGTDLMDALTTQLVQNGRFEVVERQNIEKIKQEQLLALQGYGNEKNNLELGNIFVASALIFGNISTANYQEKPVSSETRQTKEGKKYTVNTRYGHFAYRANLKFIDASSSKIIAIKEIDLSQSYTTTAINETPKIINADEILSQKTKQTVEKFMTMIAPFYISKNMSFESDKKMPELKNYTTMLQTNNFDMALKGFEELSSRNYVESIVKAKAMYNYALLLTNSGEPQKAIEILNEVNRIIPANYKYLTALSDAKNELQMKKKLKEQGL